MIRIMDFVLSFSHERDLLESSIGVLIYCSDILNAWICKCRI